MHRFIKRYSRELIMGLLAVTLLAGCGGGTPSATVTASAASDSANANSKTVTTTLDTAIDITIRARSDAGASQQFQILGQPANGVLTGPMSGEEITVRYTPNPGFSGKDVFNFQVTDADGNVANGTVTIVVLAQADPQTDTDGDGLTDLEELNVYGTNPRIADTDGDTLSDYQEVVDLAFDPQSNNYRFNPLIADLPKLRVEIVDLPDVKMNFTTTSGTVRSFSSSQTATDTTVTTTTRGGRQSYTLEVREKEKLDAGANVAGAYAGAKAGFSNGVPMSVVGPSASASAAAGSAYVNYSATKDTKQTQSSSYYWSESQQRTNTLTRTESEQYATSNSVTQTGARLSTAIRVFNDGNVPFRLDNLSLVASYLKAGDLWRHVGTLNFDGGGSFPGITLEAGTGSGVMVFSNDALDVGTGNSLLASTGLDVDVSTAELVRADGTPFAFNQINLDGRTAKIIVDYAGVRPTETYQVAVVTDDSRSYKTLAEILEMLKITYTADAGKVIQVRDVSASSAQMSFWMALHVSSDGLTIRETIYDAQGPTADYPDALTFTQSSFDAIRIKPGDVLIMGYIDDGDEDGLLRNTEIALQTDPANPDTDGDGILDGSELAGWDVAITDSDQPIRNGIGNGRATYWPAANNVSRFPFNGDLDEVRFWDVARTAADIQGDMAQPLSSPYSANLKAYWPMDNVIDGAGNMSFSGTDGVGPDVTGNGYDLAVRYITGSGTASSIVVAHPANSAFGSFYRLDGVDDTLTVPNAAFMLPDSITLEARFRTTGSGVIFSYGKEYEWWYTPAVYVGTDGHLYGLIWGDNTQPMKSADVVNDGNWHHVALVYDDSARKQTLYLDGQEVESLYGDRVKIVSTTYRARSNPVVADSDGDGIDDGTERVNRSDAGRKDTDGDWLTDDVDARPFQTLNLDVSNMTSTKPSANQLNTQGDPYTQISFDVPNPGAGDGVNDYAVVLLEQVALPGQALPLRALPADGVSPALNSSLACDGRTDCWKVVSNSYDYQSSPITPGQRFTSENRSVPGDEQERSYRVLVRVNGKWHHSSQSTSQFLGSSVKVTVKAISLITDVCYEGNYTCEYAWDMVLNSGQNGSWQNLLYKRYDNNPWAETGGGKVLAADPGSERSIVIPATAGSCFNIQSILTELDDGTVYKRRPYVAVFCYDDGWGSQDRDGTSQIEGIYTSWANNRPPSVQNGTQVYKGARYRGHILSLVASNGSATGAGFTGSFDYFSPMLWSKGGYGQYRQGYHEISARFRYRVTIEPAP